MGLARLNAAVPASTSTRSTSSVAYATEDNASDDSTANPVRRERRSWCARCEGIGLPTTYRLRDESSASSATVSFQGPTGLADGLEVGSPLSAFAVRRR